MPVVILAAFIRTEIHQCEHYYLAAELGMVVRLPQTISFTRSSNTVEKRLIKYITYINETSIIMMEHFF